MKRTKNQQKNLDRLIHELKFEDRNKCTGELAKINKLTGEYWFCATGLAYEIVDYEGWSELRSSNTLIHRKAKCPDFIRHHFGTTRSFPLKRKFRTKDNRNTINTLVNLNDSTKFGFEQIGIISEEVGFAMDEDDQDIKLYPYRELEEILQISKAKNLMNL
jgi:hypothetical protein